MDVKYQVFVSSTFVDLEDERRTVIEMILNMGHIPVGMEAFQASDDTQWDYIKRRIDESDYYVLIVAERYGSEQKGKSYTQMEYEYAVKTGVPAVAFLLDGSARKDWPSSKVEHEKKAKVENFRKLCQKKLVKFWKNSDDLGGKVALALSELIRDKPRTGWVRGDTVPSANVLNEISRLSDEKRQLQTEVERLSDSERIMQIPTEVRWQINDLRSKQVSDYCVKHGTSFSWDGSVLDFFLRCVPDFTAEVSVYSVRYNYQELFQGPNRTSDDALSDVIDEIIREFLLANLIEKHVVQTYSFNKPSSSENYRLTEYGKKFVMFLREQTNREAQQGVILADAKP